MMSGVIERYEYQELAERAHRARTIARALRHDLDNHPPADAAVRAEAEARCRRYAAEAAAFEVALKRARGY